MLNFCDWIDSYFGLKVLLICWVFHWILKIELSSRKFDHFLTWFRHLVKDWKVKLNVGKLRFDLCVWDLEKEPPFKKPKYCDNRIYNDLRLVKKPWEMVVDYIYEFHPTLKEGLDISIVGFGISHLSKKRLINSWVGNRVIWFNSLNSIH